MGGSDVHRRLQRHQILHHGHIGSSRLLRRLARNPAPTLHAGRCGLDQMFFAAPRAHGNEPLGSQLRCLLDDPLHAVELEDREQQRYWKRRLCFYLRQQRKAHRISSDPGNDGTPHPVPRNHLALHPGLRAQHTNQVCRLLTLEGSAGLVPFVGDPSSSRHGATVSSKGGMVRYHFGKHKRPPGPAPRISCRACWRWRTSEVRSLHPAVTHRSSARDACRPGTTAQPGFWDFVVKGCRSRINTGDASLSKNTSGDAFGVPRLCCLLRCLLTSSLRFSWLPSSLASLLLLSWLPFFLFSLCRVDIEPARDTLQLTNV